MFWRAFSTSRSLQCFYCHEWSDLKTKSRIPDWKCPNCDALNILDENGEIADEIPAHYMKETEREPHCVAQPKAPGLSTPFCSVCTSNQALLMKTLASYLPDDDHPDIDVYERALPAYKASLEERYPPVCSACAPNVQSRLQRNNYIAKSTALGNFLTGTKSLPHLATNPGLLSKLLRTSIWVVRGLLWVSASLAMLIWFAIGATAPATQKFGTRLQVADYDAAPYMMSSVRTRYLTQHSVAVSYGLLRVWLPVTLIGALWNPKGLSTIFQPTIKLRGKDEYVKLQLLIVCLRFVTIYALPHLNIRTDIHMRLSVLFLLLSTLHFILSFNLLDVVPRTKVDLKDQSWNLKDSIQNLDAAEGLADEQHEPALPESIPDRVSVQQGDESDEEVDSGQTDSMDWQPSPSNARIISSSPFLTTTTSSVMPSMFPRPIFAQPRERYFSTNQSHQTGSMLLPTLSHSDKRASAQDEQPHLAPQRFFAPERPTGLENLFSAAVRLDDEPLLVRSIKSIKRAPKKSGMMLLFCSLGMLPLQYFGFSRACISLGTVSILGFAYFGLLTSRERPLLALWLIVGLATELGGERLEEVNVTLLMWLCVGSTIVGQSYLVFRACTQRRPSDTKKGRSKQTRRVVSRERQ